MTIFSTMSFWNFTRFVIDFIPSDLLQRFHVSTENICYFDHQNIGFWFHARCWFDGFLLHPEHTPHVVALWSAFVACSRGCDYGRMEIKKQRVSWILRPQRWLR